MILLKKHIKRNKAQSAGAEEYTDYIFGYDIKQSDGEVPVMF